MTNRKMLNSTAYKTYLAFATGAITPKKARKFKKHASLSKNKTLVAIKEPAEKPTKKPATKRQSAGVQIRDTPGVSVSKKKTLTKTERSKGIELLSDATLLEEAQLKKAIKQSKRETNIHQAGGSRKGAGLEPKVPDEQKGKSTDTSKGIDLIQGVLNVSKADYSESEYESWGDSDDDDQQNDDEQNMCDNLRTSDDEEKTQENKFVHTPKDYVPTDNENIDDEEYDCINEEMYSDVHVELKDTKLEGEGKDDEEMTDAGHVDSEHENRLSLRWISKSNMNPSIQTSSLLTVHVTVIPKTSSAPATTIPPPIPSFILLPQQSTPIPTPTTTEATISTTSAPDSSTLTAIHQRLFDLDNKVKTLRNIDHSLAIRATIKSEVPTVVKEYTGTSLDDTLHKVIQRHIVKLIKEHVIQADVIKVLQHQHTPQKSAADIHKFKIKQAGKQQETKYTITSSDTTTLQEFD
nr:hypothetical protein [Tanacetum cinerariifolium]